MRDANRKGRHTQEYGTWVAVATQAGRTVDEDLPGGGYALRLVVMLSHLLHVA